MSRINCREGLDAPMFNNQFFGMVFRAEFHDCSILSPGKSYAQELN